MRKKIGLIVASIVLLAMQGFAAGKFVLVIDAGHGGKDPGAIGKTSQEKDLNLKVALAFGSYVEKNCPDVKVIYTRKTDVFVELKERANIANKNKADLFISIHTNALDGGKISRGFETYTLGMHRAADNLNVAKRENSVIFIEKNYKQTYAGFDPNSAESYIMFEILQDKNMANSVELAKMIQNEVCSASGRVNKGVHQAGFLVLRETSMPSCLIEMGFITTPDEETYLNTKEGQDKIAKGIYNAFVKYKKKYGVKVAQNENDSQTNEFGPSGDLDMKDLASNETGLLSAQSDEEDNGNDENIPTNSIVEQDDNLYAVTEYAQPRAVRGIGDISTNTNPQDPVPLSIPDETALNNSRQQNNPDKEIPAKSPSGNLAVNNQQTTNAKEKQENIPANQSATPNNHASPQITTDEKNVLASHTENVSPQITDVANKANSQKITSQENTKPSRNQAPSHTPTSTTNQKPAQPATSAQTTNTVQKPAEPVKAQTTDISQKPQKPVVAQTTNTTQKPAGPAVVAQTTNTTNTTQKPVEPVVAQTTNTTQKPTEPAVVAQTTNTTQKPAEPAVVGQTTNTTQKPVEPAVVAQTTDISQKPVEPVVAQTTNTTQKPVEPAVVAQTTNTTQKPVGPAVVAQTTDITQKPAAPATSVQTTNTTQKPAEPAVVAQTTNTTQKPAGPAVVAQTTNTTQKPSELAVAAQTTNTTQKPAEPGVVAQTANTTQKPAEPVVVAQTTNTIQKPAEPGVVAQTANTTQKPAEPAVVAQTANTTQKPVEPAVVAQTTDANQQQPKQKHSEERQQAATSHPGFSELPEVTAPPQGAILEGKPIFKVQIAATTEPKNINSDFFHGFKNVDAYTENGMVKYTIGATDNFAEVESLRNTLVDKFPGAFIIAFRDGYKIPLQSALREYRRQQ